MKNNLNFDLSKSSRIFIDHIDEYGKSRYLEKFSFQGVLDLVKIDQAVWEVRRYCTTSKSKNIVKLVAGKPAPMVQLDGGYLEKVIKNQKHPARTNFLKQNAYFGSRKRSKVSLSRFAYRAINSPLIHFADRLDEIAKYIFIPREDIEMYKKLSEPGNGMK